MSNCPSASRCCVLIRQFFSSKEVQPHRLVKVRQFEGNAVLHLVANPSIVAHDVLHSFERAEVREHACDTFFQQPWVLDDLQAICEYTCLLDGAQF